MIYAICITVVLCCLILQHTMIEIAEKKFSYHSIDAIAERLREIRLETSLSSVAKEKLIELALKGTNNDEKLS